MGNFTIYKITNKIDGKSYVGVTSRSVPRRWNEHCRDARHSEPIHKFHIAIMSHGVDAFDVVVLESNLDQEKALERETYYIELFDCVESGYNIRLRNAYPDGAAVSAAFSRAQPEVQTARIARLREVFDIWYGGLSDDERNEYHAKKAIGNARFNASLPDDERQSRSRRAKAWWENMDADEITLLKSKYAARKAKRYIVRSPEGVVHHVVGLKAFCVERGLHQGAMSAVARGKYKHYKGWTVIFDD